MEEIEEDVYEPFLETAQYFLEKYGEKNALSKLMVLLFGWK